MGFLSFSARALFLKAKLNQLNYQNMKLSQEQQTITAQIANKQQAINNAKNQIKAQAQQFVMGNVLGGLANDANVSSILNSMGIDQCSNNDLQTLLAGGKITIEGKDYQFSAEHFGQIQPLQQQLMTQAQMQAAFASNVMTNTIDISAQSDLAILNAKDNQISLELENNTAQADLVSNEYNAVKDARSKEAQNSAPSFGLA